jgi:3-dehydroquinate dehydratase-2
MNILIINGPNLNILGKRDESLYGTKSLTEINNILAKVGQSIGMDLSFFQSNDEGKIVDFIQDNSAQSSGIIINPGALTHYGFSLRDALADTQLPIIEVHLSNIYAREDWRAKSVISPVTRGQITGLGWQGYIAALRLIAGELRGELWE